jgi:hypothetical protein
MQRTRLIAATLIALTGLTAHADSPTVFGMELQKPFVVPECPYKHLTKTLLEYWPPPTQGVCYQMTEDKDAGKPRPINDQVKLRWPDNGSPRLVIAYSATATIIDGNLEGIAFNTLGIQSQERDLTALKEKYGEPTQIANDTVQNGYAAKFSPIRASWTLGDIVVALDGAQSQVNSGLIRIETVQSMAARNAFFEKLHHSKPSL